MFSTKNFFIGEIYQKGIAFCIKQIKKEWNTKVDYNMNLIAGLRYLTGASYKLLKWASSEFILYFQKLPQADFYGEVSSNML